MNHIPITTVHIQNNLPDTRLKAHGEMVEKIDLQSRA
jgi:hypothetical protein